MAMGRNYIAADSKVLKLFIIYRIYDSSYNSKSQNSGLVYGI